jgi:hypothetical protein
MGCPIQPLYTTSGSSSATDARRRTDIIVFTYAGRADVDLLYGPDCFSYIDNGFISTGVPSVGL